MNSLSKWITFGSLLALISARIATACPLVAGKYVDYNCDQKFKIALTGDSIVFGVGDSEHTIEESGYVNRIRALLPLIEAENIGVPGITSGQLLRAFKKNLTKYPPGITRTKSANADVFFIDVGRNDYWQKRPAIHTVTNIKRIVKYLRETLTLIDGTPPFIVVSTLIPTTRGFQKPFIDAVNAELKKQASKDLPVYLHFGRLDPGLISIDGLHPDTPGYDALSIMLKRFLVRECQTMLKKERVDRDRDRIYDLFEEIRYGTDPTLKDTDGDGIKDGDEIFTTLTDPLTANYFTPVVVAK